MNNQEASQELWFRRNAYQSEIYPYNKLKVPSTGIVGLVIDFLLLVSGWVSDNSCCYMQDYKRKYPDVVVLDPPEAILQLRNRQSMLQDVTELDMSHCGGAFLVTSLVQSSSPGVKS